MLISLPFRFLGRLVLYVVRPVAYGALVLVRGVLRVLALILGGLWFVLARAVDALFWPLTKILDGIRGAYPGALSAALRARWAILPPAFAAFVLAVLATPLLGTNLVPDLAQGEFAFRVRLPEGSTLESSAETIGRVEDRLIASGGASLSRRRSLLLSGTSDPSICWPAAGSSLVSCRLSWPNLASLGGHGDRARGDDFMSVTSALRRELIEIIEWTDATRDTLSYRFPDDDKAFEAAFVAVSAVAAWMEYDEGNTQFVSTADFVCEGSPGLFTHGVTG